MKQQKDFVINFMNGNERMRIRILSSDMYDSEIQELKQTILLLKEFNHFCTFLDEGERLTVIDGNYIEIDNDELKTSLKSIWGGRTDDIFSILLATLTSIQ